MDLQFVNGNPSQKDWVHSAIQACGFDLSLIGSTVWVHFVDPLPVSSDLGHSHAYMVTQQTPTGFTISIATWANDPDNSNNQGLPNPPEDIFDFFKQSFVHELGHVVHFTSITTDTERAQAASLFWTPTVDGGSGRRYGTLGDWSANTWPNNMMEAIAETFKCTYYAGRLIFANRTEWRIDQSAWSALWSLLIPGLQPLFQSADNAFINDAPSSVQIDVPGQFGIAYLQNAIAAVLVGPFTQKPIDPCLNPGGFAVIHLNLVTQPGGNPVSQITLEPQFTGFGLGCLPPGGEWFGTGRTFISFGFEAPAQTDLGQEQTLLKITAQPGVNPGDLVVEASGGGADYVRTLTGFSPDGLLSAQLQVDTFGDIEPNIGPLQWGVISKLSVPPFPFLSATGAMTPGAAASGLIRVG